MGLDSINGGYAGTVLEYILLEVFVFSSARMKKTNVFVDFSICYDKRSKMISASSLFVSAAKNNDSTSAVDQAGRPKGF